MDGHQYLRNGTVHTGGHYVERGNGQPSPYVKWGNATNLHQIDLVKEPVWYENPDCEVVYDNAQPSENAVVFVTKGESGATEGGDVSQRRNCLENNPTHQRGCQMRGRQHRLYKSRRGGNVPRHRLQERLL